MGPKKNERQREREREGGEKERGEEKEQEFERPRLGGSPKSAVPAGEERLLPIETGKLKRGKDQTIV